MAKLYNLAGHTTATSGTGTITLGAAISGYLTFALAGVANADIVDYAIKDGVNAEIGTGTYTSIGTTLTRTVTKSTNANAAISLSGTATVFISPRAETLNDASVLTGGTLPVGRLSFTLAELNTMISNADLAAVATSGSATDLTTGTLPAARLSFSVAEANTALAVADFYTSGGTDVALADGGTGASLTDPNADRIMFWDDSAGAVTWLTPGAGLTITATTIDAAGGTEASAAEMETPTGSTQMVTPRRVIAHPLVAKCWVKWGVTTTIDADYGVSSITDHAGGDWTVTFDTAFSSVHYAVALGSEAPGDQIYVSGVKTSGQAAGSCRVIVGLDVSGGADPTKNYLVAFGDQ